MTRQEIKKRRTIRAMGRKKMIIIEKTRVKHDLVLFVAPPQFYTFWERLKSLFNFDKFEMPQYFNFKGHPAEISQTRLSMFAPKTYTKIYGEN